MPRRDCQPWTCLGISGPLLCVDVWTVAMRPASGYDGQAAAPASAVHTRQQEKSRYLPPTNAVAASARTRCLTMLLDILNHRTTRAVSALSSRTCRGRLHLLPVSPPTKPSQTYSQDQDVSDKGLTFIICRVSPWREMSTAGAAPFDGDAPELFLLPFAFPMVQPASLARARENRSFLSSALQHENIGHHYSPPVPCLWWREARGKQIAAVKKKGGVR